MKEKSDTEQKCFRMMKTVNKLRVLKSVSLEDIPIGHPKPTPPFRCPACRGTITEKPVLVLESEEKGFMIRSEHCGHDLLERQADSENAQSMLQVLEKRLPTKCGFKYMKSNIHLGKRKHERRSREHFL